MMNVILTVFLGTASTSVLGYLWYSQTMFGDLWAQAAKLNQKDIPKDQSECLLMEFVSRVIRCSCYLLLHYALKINDYIVAMELALFLVVGFILPQILSRLAWEMKNQHYMFIQFCEQAVSMLIIALLTCYFYSEK